MSDGRPHLFSASGDVLDPTEHGRGPWDPDLLHGGAVSGALGWASQRVVEADDGDGTFALCRLTTEILRPVPVEPLRFTSSVVRSGRKAKVISAELSLGDATVARSSSQWARVLPGDPVDSRPDAAVPRRPVHPTDPAAADFDYPRPGFNCDVFELRCLQGNTEDPGPGVVWARMRVDVVAGERPGPAETLATVADLANAVGWEPSLRGDPMINPDVTLQVFRYPVADWICLAAQARSTSAGIGMMEAVLWDGHGQLGRVLATTIENTGVELAALPRPIDNT